MSQAAIKPSDIREQVEDIGVSLEKFGRTPVAGRVFAYLLLADPPEKTFDQIVDFVQSSKSSVSVALKTLRNDGSVKYRTYSGDRKKYFCVDTQGWQKNLRESAKNLSAFNVLLATVVTYRKDCDSEQFNSEIQSLLDFQIYLTKAIEEAIDAWSDNLPNHLKKA